LQLATPAMHRSFPRCAAMLMLLFLAIHNAWDLVTYLAVEHSRPETTSKD
jgi:hypothetical protein